MFPEVQNKAPANSIIDTHAHYDDTKFDGIREALLGEMPSYGILAIINNSIDLNASAESVLSFSEKYPFCYSAIGLHPETVENGVDFDESRFRALLKKDRVVAVGEIGLDYHWSENYKEKQKQIFARQLEIANETGLPVIIHDRDAHADTLDMLKTYKPKGTVHCFSGSVEMAKELLNLDMYVGVGGVLTFNNAKKLVDVVKYCPLDRLLLETDAPYLAPVPYRGNLCNSAQIIRIAEKLAEIKNIPVETVLETTVNNAKTVYKL